MRIEDQSHFDDSLAELDDHGRKALRAGAEVAQAAVRAITPRKSGKLAASIQVTVSGNEAAVHTDSPYAIKQHEKVGFKHTSGQAKFLEIGVLANQTAILQEIANAYRLD
ncbi:HK97 gp10 family phage protein [Gordonia sp. (in: high G+C Gram-positive bacteria)]|uniref:HK97 gp10 family phage protein n=1 Tax=Gordonia sp. (in: high G+C Gram-positive bacteria) TaxID=84139 RepID=UPI003C77C6DC